jgi:hypothetical protein
LPAWSALWGILQGQAIDCDAVNFSLSLLQWLVADRDVYLAIAVIWIRS